MAEILGLYMTGLNVITSLNTISGRTVASKKHIERLLGELKLLKALLIESLTIWRDLPGRPPESASVAITRC
jgi:hypothetical protein